MTACSNAMCRPRDIAQDNCEYTAMGWFSAPEFSRYSYYRDIGSSMCLQSSTNVPPINGSSPLAVNMIVAECCQQLSDWHHRFCWQYANIHLISATIQLPTWNV